MPIKYNLTKFDTIAEKIHELSHKGSTTFNDDEETTQAEAIIISSFSSSYSWQTDKVISGGNHNLLYSPAIKSEYMMATKENWKKIRNTDVQEVSCKNISDSFFYMWLAINVERPKHKAFKRGWERLKTEFAEECDGIRLQRN
ncbi:MAG: hypothetical protein ABSA33_00160 [Candidatus Micrarchaeaceae archaeon]|jgi:hypothetical protein